MKIVKHIFRRPNVKRQAKAEADEKAKLPVHVKAIKKKALLVGVKDIREEVKGVSAGVKPPQRGGPVTQIKTRLKAVRKTNRLDSLRGPHRDVRVMRDLLITSDIVVLIDDDDPRHPELQPTRENILKQIKLLVDNAQENDRFFFHFAGHATQEETDDIDEEDGLNEFIVPSDGKNIKDNELRAALVDPLPPKTSLIAVFDSCFSASLLDLKHFRCNRVYVPWLNKGNRRTNSLWNLNERKHAKISTRGGPPPALRLHERHGKWARTSLDQVMESPADPQGIGSKPMSQASTTKCSLSISTEGLQKPSSMWLDSPSGMGRQYESPVALYCNGFCRDFAPAVDPNSNTPDVICISSSKDSQRSWEDSNGNSMSQILVKLLTSNPHPTYQDLMTLVSHEIHAFYLDLHSKSRDYKKRIRAKNAKEIEQGRKPTQGLAVEMNNFQNPQLSSDRPLDMSRKFYP
ncbi:hypothetical protein M413DRAFT_167260 [Hebeloma cylindrosporum]|uniref:Peptidase C14 caspase domain-containing protein n=1 Tax=Hebeloma cylindrosporum TaxID=76867 RepID=A0A0C3CAY3_HEBCY|nr:hypothetical protein M413DRAFT_167260 [Hebeloma cylindrosporum h7]